MSAFIRNLLSVLTLALFPLGCGGADRPIDAEFGAGVRTVTVGPGGATLRGAGGTPLAGVILEIPPGALRSLIRLELKAGGDLDLPGTVPVAVGLALTATPDPGPLLVPATLQMRFGYSPVRAVGDLVVVDRRPGQPSLGVAASSGSYDRGQQTFTAALGSLADLQVRAALEPRRHEDAKALVELALSSLDRQTDEALVQADQYLAGALFADPFDPVARLLRAMTRILVVANDRSDTGPGLQSVGEVLTRWGLDLRSHSLLRRLVHGDWPGYFTPDPSRPTVADALELLQARLRPELLAGLADLEFIPDHEIVVLRLPPLFADLRPGEREIDTADFFFLRSLYQAVLFGLDALEDLDTRVDVGYLLGEGRADNLESLLARFPDVGRLLSPPSERTVVALNKAVAVLDLAVRMLGTEADDQADDLMVYPETLDAAGRDRWAGNLRGLAENLLRGGAAHPVLSTDAPALIVDLKPLLLGIDYRGLLPQVYRWAPLAGTLPDPTFAGLLPGFGQAGAADRFGFANRVDPAQTPIVIDGSFEDWPTTAEALLPADPSGDSGDLPDLDLSRLFLAWAGDELCCRMSLASGTFHHDPAVAASYGIELVPQPDRGVLPTPVVRLVVTMTPAGPELAVFRDGQPVVARPKVASSGGDLEWSVSRFALFAPDELIQDRALHGFSEGAEVSGSRTGSDRTRVVLLRL